MDNLPVEVYGEQPGSGGTDTNTGGSTTHRAVRRGIPGEPLMAVLEEWGTHYVGLSRVRNNAVLMRLALPAIDAVVLGRAVQRHRRPRAPRLGPRVVLTARSRGPAPAAWCRSWWNGPTSSSRAASGS